MQPLLSLRNVAYRRGDFLLEVERLDLGRGELYALLGPNGAGKSTLLQIMALLTRPDTGTIELNGRPVLWHSRSLRCARNSVTLVHQSPYLFDLSVYRNLAFGLHLRGIRGEEERMRVASALAAVGLEGFETRRARQLSGGETQRVALARALALAPRLLLLDEPTSGTHPEAVPGIEQVIMGLRREGTTIIVASHDPDQARRLEGGVLCLDRGRLTAAHGCPALPDCRRAAGG